MRWISLRCLAMAMRWIKPAGKIIKDKTSIKNRDVLVVEDIIDTGHTLAQVLQIMHTRKPKSLSVCTLLNKPHAEK